MANSCFKFAVEPYCPASEDEALEELAWLIIERRGWIATPELLFSLISDLKSQLTEDDGWS